MRDWLVGQLAHLLDDLGSKARGGLCFNHHHAFIANDDAGVRITLGGEGPQIAADFVEGDFLFSHVALGGKCFGHGSVLTSGVFGALGGMGYGKGCKGRGDPPLLRYGNLMAGLMVPVQVPKPIL